MRKLIFIAVAILSAAAAYGQADNKRDLVVTVTDAKGKSINGIELFMYINQDAATLLATDGKQPTIIGGVTDKDTLNIIVAKTVHEFPLQGLDSLQLVFKNKKMLGYQNPREEKVINTGYMTVPLSRNATASSMVDMSYISSFNSIANYLEGRVAGVEVISKNGKVDLRIRGKSSLTTLSTPPIDSKKGQGSLSGSTADFSDPSLEMTQNFSSGGGPGLIEGVSPLVIVDGMEIGDFDYVNSTIPTSQVASITVLKDGSMYGAQGGAGVVVITTKSGR